MTSEPTRLMEALPAARTPLEVLEALAEAGSDHGFELWAMAVVRNHAPAVYLCTTAPLPPAAVATNLEHFVTCASKLDCEGDQLMPDWSQATRHAMCLQPYAPVVTRGLAEYQDRHVPTGQPTGAIIRGATLSETASGAAPPAWDLLESLIRYATPYLRAVDLATTDTARGMIDVDSGAYSWPYFVDAVERECDRARRCGVEVSLAVVDLKPMRMLREITPDLHRRVGDHLQACVRQTDLVGRIGERTYAAFLHNTGPRPALIAAGRIADAMKGDEVLEATLSFSIGVSGWEKSGPVEGSLLLAQASEAAAEAAQVAPGCAFVYL
jgi:GGDEF domain-containing protein